MSDGVAIALITVVIGGLFTGLYKIIDAKTTRASNEVARNIGQVEVINKTLEGMQTLLNSRETALEREMDRADREASRADYWIKHAGDLEKDLAEEKAINVALSNEVERLRDADTNN